MVPTTVDSDSLTRAVATEQIIYDPSTPLETLLILMVDDDLLVAHAAEVAIHRRVALALLSSESPETP